MINEGIKLLLFIADQIPKKSVQAGLGTSMQVLIGSGDAYFSVSAHLKLSRILMFAFRSLLLQNVSIDIL